MQKLRDIQEQFANHLLGQPSKPEIAGEIKFNHLQNTQRLQVYKNNFKSNLKSHLSSIYPVIVKLVGEKFFNYCSSEFISQYPSINGNLHAYGEQFSTFLDTFEPAKSLSYLPDMAKFEWACHEVFHEANTKVFDIERLQNLEEDDYASIVFMLNPASRLIDALYPLLDIWQTNQSDEPEVITIASKPYFYLIGRRNFEIIFQSHTEIEYTFLTLLQRGDKLEEITHFLSDRYDDKEIDMNDLLVKNVSLGNICDFKLS